ncbi:MAG: alpha/beta hydrolase [Thermoplasmata archaeon]|nr:alpha/beta hydrolase [Candidatus Sysuiplasma jiujiangense]
MGDRDDRSSLPFAKLVSREIPDSKLVIVPGADHLINLSRPDEFETELRSALRRAR